MLASAIAVTGACAGAPPRAGATADANSRLAPEDPRTAARELDLLPRQVHPLLLAALDDPYVLATTDCAVLGAQVAELDRLLGPDLDSASRPSTRGDAAEHMLVGGIASAAPYFGWVRRLTGADRRQRLAQAAFDAGVARRGFLKGVGRQVGCVPPAAPATRVAVPEALR